MKFILLDLERTLGNGIPTYWKSNKRGYTFNIHEAGLYSEKEAEEIAKSCAFLNFIFTDLVLQISPRIDHLITVKTEKSFSISSKSPVDLLLEKRDYIKENVFTKKYLTLFSKEIDVITSPLGLSKQDKMREIEYCQRFLLISAEYTTEK